MLADEQMKALIELGRNGHFPLFHSSWIEEVTREKSKKFTKQDQKKAHEIIDKISKHKNLDRKKTILLSLSDEERKIFIKEFFNLVEQSILEERPILQ